MVGERGRAPANLRFVNGRYHWRIVIPEDLRAHFGKRELVRTTKTGDVLKAQALSAPWTLEARTRFEDLRRRREASADDITAVAREVLAEGLRDLPKPSGDLEEWSDQIDRERSAWASVLDQDHFPESWPVDEAIEAVRARGFTLRAGGILADLAANKIARAKLQVLAVAEARAAGDYTVQPWDDLGDGGRTPGPAPAAFSGRPASPLLSEVFEKYLAEGARSWARKTAADNAIARVVALDIIGDLPVADLTRQHVRDLRDVALALPATWRQAPEYRGRRARDIAAEKPEGTKLKPATVAHYLIGLSGALKFAKAEGWIDANVAVGLTHVPDPVPVKHRRLEWSIADLNRWYAQDIYQAPKDSWGAQSWLPLLALYSGLRLEELARLNVADVRKTDGIILAIHVAWREGSPLKTKSSERIVPVHSQLLAAGFSEYIARTRESGSERLWPDLSLSPGSGKWGSAFAKWFGRARRRAGITERRVTFHSLRATFGTAMFNAGAPLERVEYILGHTPKGITLAAYVKRIDLRMLKGDVDRVVYRGLTLGRNGT